ncbi:hypothetical protein Asp14428_39900 [Actinoplanes sp. NBRC 14428]|nr:hypothetical protein Asp14428_39900 [Actinoplanes sp. NBRC 14428]
MHPTRATVLTGILTVGLTLTQQACTPVNRHTNRPVAFTVPTDPLTGARRLVIKPAPPTTTVVTVDARGRLTTTDGEPPLSLFVLTPAGPHHLIRAADGTCAEATPTRTIRTAPCDPARDAQLFTITPQKTPPQTYAISNGGAFLQPTPTGELTLETPLRTTYALIDNGPAPLDQLSGP